MFKEEYTYQEALETPTCPGINGSYPPVEFNRGEYILKEGHPESHKQQYVELVKRFDNPFIVDFGGGGGINYQIVKDYPFQYYIVETERTCKYAVEELRIKNINFVSSIFDINQPIDIFYSNAGLQYNIEIYKTLEYINTILNPQYILIHRFHFTPREKTYLTKQKAYDVFLWIFNIDDFTQQLSNYTFEILPEYDTPSYNIVNGVFKEKCQYKPILFTRINT